MASTELQFPERAQVKIFREFGFDAGHRIQNHESKCKNLHGHRYKVILHFRTGHLDTLHRVLDFGAIKELWGDWIDRFVDHVMILHCKDWEARKALERIPKQRVYLMDSPPTAEAIAEHILRDVAPAIMQGTGVEVYKAVVYETPNCGAEAALEA